MKRAIIVTLALCLCPAIAFAGGDGEDDPNADRHQACNWPNFHPGILKRSDEMRTCWEEHGGGVEPAVAEVEWTQTSPPPDEEVSAAVTTGSEALAACLKKQFEAIAIRSTDDTTCKASVQLTYKPGGPKNDVRYEITAKSPDSSKKHGTKQKAPSKNDAEPKKLKNILGAPGDFDVKMRVAMSGDGEELQVGRDAGGMGLRGAGSRNEDEPGDKDEIGDKDDETEKGEPNPILRPIRFDRLEASKGCNTEGLLETLQTKSSAFRYCYKRQFQANPELEGNVTIRWKLDGKGGETQAKVDDASLNSRKVTGCVRRVVERIRFDDSQEKKCEASYRFEFRRANSN